MNALNTAKKKWGCSTIGVAVLMVCGALYLGTQFFGGGNTADPTGSIDNNNGNTNAQNSFDNINLGSLEISEQIDRDGCAVNRVSSLRNVDAFYVIAPNSQYPEGTTVFARLYRDGTAIEDLPLITANQDYSNSCINFVFETTNGNNFQSGDYEVEFFVNGNSYNSIRFNLG